MGERTGRLLGPTPLALSAQDEEVCEQPGDGGPTLSCSFERVCLLGALPSLDTGECDSSAKSQPHVCMCVCVPSPPFACLLVSCKGFVRLNLG